MPADLGHQLPDLARQVKAAAFPIPGQILTAAFDRTVLADYARATDADERRQRSAVAFRPADQLGGVANLVEIAVASISSGLSLSRHAARSMQ
jgi:hypothetical protein